MLRVPTEPLACRHLLRIPMLHKSRVRPTGCADKNFSVHTSTKSQRLRKQTRLHFQLSSRRTNVFRFAQHPHRTYFRRAGWSSLVARQAHNLKVAGSNPAPATNFFTDRCVNSDFLTRKEALAAIGGAGKIYTPKPRKKNPA